MKNIRSFFISLYILNAMFSEIYADTHAHAYEKQNVGKEMEGLACTDKRGIPYLLLSDGTMYGVDAWPQNVLGHYIHVIVEEKDITSRKVEKVKIIHSCRAHKTFPFKAYGIIRYDPKKYKGGHPGLEMELDNGKTILISISGSSEQLNANKDTRRQIIGTLHILPLLGEEKNQSGIVQQEYRSAGEAVYILIKK